MSNITVYGRVECRHTEGEKWIIDKDRLEYLFCYLSLYLVVFLYQKLEAIVPSKIKSRHRF